MLHIILRKNYKEIITTMIVICSLYAGLILLVRENDLVFGWRIFWMIALLLPLTQVLMPSYVTFDATGTGRVVVKSWTIVFYKNYCHECLSNFKQIDRIRTTDIHMGYGAGEIEAVYFIFEDGAKIWLPYSEGMEEKIVNWYHKNYCKWLPIFEIYDFYITSDGYIKFDASGGRASRCKVKYPHGYSIKKENGKYFYVR